MPYLGTSFLQSIFLFFLFLLLIIPGIIYSIYRLFATMESVIGDTRYKKALDTSKAMVL